MKKIFTIALLRDLEKQVMNGDISYSRMVEILNEKAAEAYLADHFGPCQLTTLIETIRKVLDAEKRIDYIAHAGKGYEGVPTMEKFIKDNGVTSYDLVKEAGVYKANIRSIQIGDDVIEDNGDRGPVSVKFEEIRPNIEEDPHTKCDYRNAECSEFGYMVGGSWVCSNHIAAARKIGSRVP